MPSFYRHIGLGKASLAPSDVHRGPVRAQSFWAWRATPLPSVTQAPNIQSPGPSPSPGSPDQGEKANQEVHWFSPRPCLLHSLLKAHVPQMASCTPGIRPEILRGLKDGVGRWLLIGCSCVASRVHTNPTTWRSLLPTWPRPFLAQPITSPAPRTPLVGQRERERQN